MTEQSTDLLLGDACAHTGAHGSASATGVRLHQAGLERGAGSGVEDNDGVEGDGWIKHRKETRKVGNNS